MMWPERVMLYEIQQHTKIFLNTTTMNTPLAEKNASKNLEEYVGQEHPLARKAD